MERFWINFSFGQGIMLANAFRSIKSQKDRVAGDQVGQFGWPVCPTTVSESRLNPPGAAPSRCLVKLFFPEY